MKNVFLVLDADGRIQRKLQMPEDSVALNLLPGETYIALLEDGPAERAYIREGEILYRENMPLTFAATELTLGDALNVAGIPEGTEVTYAGGTVVVDDGFITWAPTAPGTYLVRFAHPDYMPEVLYARVA